jgi:phosphoribosyl 1,2-cyclic phosphodiesterase
MRIRIWGCRGSLTTAGREVVRYGGYTTCVEVRLDDGTLLILDAGSGIHRLGRQLLGEPGLTDMYLLLTHSHWDHLTGFPFFTPAYLDRYRIHVRGGPDAKTSLANFLRHQMDPPYFPVEFSVLKAHFDFGSSDGEEMTIGSAHVVPIPLSHPNGGYGFRIVEAGKAFVFLTDNELGYSHPGALREEDYLEAAQGADLLLHDAQYSDEEYASRTRGWGHSTYARAADFAARAGVKRLGTFHHDPDHDDREIDASVRLCGKVMRQAGSRGKCFGAAEGMILKV